MDSYLEAVEELMEAARAVIDGAEARPSRVSRVPALLLTRLARALAPLEEAARIPERRNAVEELTREAEQLGLYDDKASKK